MTAGPAVLRVCQLRGRNDLGLGPDPCVCLRAVPRGPAGLFHDGKVRESGLCRKSKSPDTFGQPKRQPAGPDHDLSRHLLDPEALGPFPVAGGVVVELLVSGPEDTTQADLLAAAEYGGGSNARAWPTTALALSDGQTKALSLALRVASNPAELQFAVADLLGAEPLPAPPAPRTGSGDGTLLKIPTPQMAPLFLVRPHAPFTPAESARAHPGRTGRADRTVTGPGDRRRGVGLSAGTKQRCCSRRWQAPNSTSGI